MNNERIAVVSNELGDLDNYRLISTNMDGPKPNEVQIHIKASGVSFVDVLNARGLYQNKADVPFTPGSECAGVIAALGSNCAPHLKIGQKVAATCWGGTFSNMINVPEKNVHVLPETMDLIEGSVFLVSIATAWHALVDRGRISQSDTVLVLGAGGATGYAAIQVAKYFGCRVIAAASNSEKLGVAAHAGADVLISSMSPTFNDDVRSGNFGKPIDIVFDPVGGELTNAGFRCLAWNGRHLIVGFTAGITSIKTNHPLLKGSSVIGVNLQQFNQNQPALASSNLKKIVDIANRGFFRPYICATYRLEEFKAAMDVVYNGKNAGRVVITI